MTSDGKVLFVDDEPNILQGLQRQLRKQFQLETAEGALAGLRAMATTGPYDVVVTDMRMPSMNGIEFLRRVQQESPDTVRLMLTGNSDQQTAVSAVNDGCVFRFLTKPCSTESLTAAVSAALQHHALVTAERELLSKTLGGSVSLLADILSLLNPTAFGSTAKIRRLCGYICSRLNLTNSWEVSTAATLALIGCITVPEDALVRQRSGGALTTIEQHLFHSHPLVGGRLIERIPRMEGVAEIIRRQNQPYRTSSVSANTGETDQTALGVNVLKTVIDFERLISQGVTNSEAIKRLQSQPDCYCPAIVKALGEAADIEHVTKQVNIVDLLEGMFLDVNLVTLNGELLLTRGSEVNATVCERLTSFATNSGRVKEPVRVLCPS